MNLIKKNIHMDRVRNSNMSQVTVEEDLNLPEYKPDVSALHLEKGSLVIEEIRTGNDVVNIGGKLVYAILYHTREESSRLVALEGELPFEERIHMQGVIPTDTVVVEGEVEDLTIGMINSRKLSVQSLLCFHACVEELFDEEIPVSVDEEGTVEFRKLPISLSEIVVCKKDVYRKKEEMSLPSSYPNIFQILWSQVELRDLEFRVVEEKLNFQGDLQVFLLYEGEGEEHPIRSFETTVPVSGSLECSGCVEGMIPNVSYHLVQQELSIRPDFDGEERNIGLEIMLELHIRIYGEVNMEMLSELYGVTKEVTTDTEERKLKQLLSKVTGKMKLTDHISIDKGNTAVLQLLHSEGDVTLEQTKNVENGITVMGLLQVKLMYVTGDDETPYGSFSGTIPYEYTLEIPGMDETAEVDITPQLEQLQVMMLDGEEVDVKSVISFRTTVFRNVPVQMITDVTVTELDHVKMNTLPGIVVYFVKEGDNLWNIGKKYYVPVDRIREMNGLKDDELKLGQKLLICS